jgi:hypothetical protein
MISRAELEELVRDACRPDRLYPIRSEKHYGHYAGHLPDGRQALITCSCLQEVRAFLFTRDGDYLGVEHRKPVLTAVPEEPYLDVNDAELRAYLVAEFGFTPGLIRVKRFDEPSEWVSVEPLTHYLADFVADPESVPEDGREGALEELREWIEAGEFVLNTWNDYWVDANGEVTSS